MLISPNDARDYCKIFKPKIYEKIKKVSKPTFMNKIFFFFFNHRDPRLYYREKILSRFFYVFVLTSYCLLLQPRITPTSSILSPKIFILFIFVVIYHHQHNFIQKKKLPGIFFGFIFLFFFSMLKKSFGCIEIF